MSETVSQSVGAKQGATKVLPTDTDQIGIVARYDILKHLRSRRLLGIIAIEVLVLVLITAIPPLLGQDYPKNGDQFVGTYAGFTSTLIIIGATLFAGDAIVSEFQSRTGYLLFPNPVKRWVILAGKFISSVGVMFLVLLIYYGAALILGLAVTGGFSTLGAESLLLAMLYAVAALAVGFLISSFMKGATGALIFTFALLFLIFSIASQMLSLGGVKPWFLLTFAGEVVSYITQVPYPVDSSITVPIGTGQSMTIWTYIPDIGPSLAVMAGYIVVAMVLSLYFFQKREMVA
jgi:ABC-2 type transport system permease protein